ncbi:MAG: hypothetical protein K8S20_12925 [Chloroflexi bacterium]|nr:hypothetical protein [Chloroflexota bacterium]
MKNISTAKPVSSNVFAQQMQTGTSSAISWPIVQTYIERKVLQLSEKGALNALGKVAAVHLDQPIVWNEWQVHVEQEPVLVVKQKGWEEAMEEVLTNRARTWEELAKL